VGFLLAVAGDMLIFAWILVVLPGADIPRIVVIRGTLIASIGFEILKVAGTYTIARSAHSATAGPFAGILAILIWIQLVSRFMLYCAAWMATAEIISAEQASSARVSLVKQPAGAAVEEDDRPAGVLTPAGVAGTLLGAGAVAGSAATLWARHRLRSVRDGGAAGARSAARERPAARPPR
jgi:membrane protein